MGTQYTPIHPVQNNIVTLLQNPSNIQDIRLQLYGRDYCYPYFPQERELLAQMVSNVWNETNIAADPNDLSDQIPNQIKTLNTMRIVRNFECSYRWRQGSQRSAPWRHCAGRLSEVICHQRRSRDEYDEGTCRPYQVRRTILHAHSNECTLENIDRTQESLHVRGTLAAYARLHKDDLATAVKRLYDFSLAMEDWEWSAGMRTLYSGATGKSALQDAGCYARVNVACLQRLLTSPFPYLKDWRYDWNTSNDNDDVDLQVTSAEKWTTSGTHKMKTQLVYTQTLRAFVSIYVGGKRGQTFGVEDVSGIDKRAWILHTTPKTNSLQWPLYTVLSRNREGLGIVLAHVLAERAEVNVLTAALRHIADYYDKSPTSNKAPDTGPSSRLRNAPDAWIVSGREEDTLAIEAVYGVMAESGPIILYCRRTSQQCIDETLTASGPEASLRELLCYIMYEATSSEEVQDACPAIEANMARLPNTQAARNLRRRFDTQYHHRWSDAFRSTRTAWRLSQATNSLVDYDAAYFHRDDGRLSRYTLAGVLERCEVTREKIEEDQRRMFDSDQRGFYHSEICAFVPIFQDFPLAAQKLIADALHCAQINKRIARQASTKTQLTDGYRLCERKCTFWRTFRLPCQHWWRQFFTNEAQLCRSDLRQMVLLLRRSFLGTNDERCGPYDRYGFEGDYLIDDYNNADESDSEYINL